MCFYTSYSQRWRFCLFWLNCYVHCDTNTKLKCQQTRCASKLMHGTQLQFEHDQPGLVTDTEHATDAFFSVIVMRFLHWFERPLSQLLLQLVGSWSLAHTLINFYDLHWDSNNKDIIQRAKKNTKWSLKLVWGSLPYLFFLLFLAFLRFLCLLLLLVFFLLFVCRILKIPT